MPFPSPKTSLPKKVKAIVIFNLCIVFSSLFWSAGQPFMGELFIYKSAAMVYQTVMGQPELLQKMDGKKAMEMKEKFQRHRQRFLELPIERQQFLQTQYALLQEKVSVPWYSKFHSAFYILIFEIPVFEKMWLVLSFAISLLILLGIEGALEVIWLLPLITICYIMDNQMNGTTTTSFAPIKTSYPTEEKIVKEYLEGPLQEDLSSQRQQLLKGWQLFLIREHANEIPSTDALVFEAQVERGEFAFYLSLVEKINPLQILDRASIFHQRKPQGILFVYFAWNVCFAWFISRKAYPQKTVCIAR